MSRRDEYLLSVKRERRDKAPADWQDQVLAIEGVKLVRGKDSRILVITVEDAAVKDVVSLAKDFCHIEAPVKIGDKRPFGFGK